MLRYGSGRTVSSTTTTTEDSPEAERKFRRLRLTLHAGENGSANLSEKNKDAKETWKKKNGLIHRERPAGRESPQQLTDEANGVPESSLQPHEPKVYGVVQRTGSDRQQEVMAREWSVSHLQNEMRYIREVRDSLEKVRERMYSQFGGMQQSMQKFTQEIKTANSRSRSLEAEVKIRTEGMDSFDQMNSSLISANLGLQKSLLENCQNRVDLREEVKTLRSTFEKNQEKLRDKENELAQAQAENQMLRLQVESSQEAGTRALHELSAKLQREYEEKLLEQQRKHREEIENLQAQLDEYIRRLEEAEKTIKNAEAKIAERDQRIIEVERLLGCMGNEKSQLQKKLQTCEQRIRLLELSDTTDSNVVQKSKQLESEAADLKERIKHLNDMVFCQQRKVKGMIEEVESLRVQVAQKDMFISELLDRIAIVECENNELEDKLKYFMSTQSRPREALDTREVGVDCDLLPRGDPNKHNVDSFSPFQPSHPNHSSLPNHHPSPFNPSSPSQPLSPIQSISPPLSPPLSPSLSPPLSPSLSPPLSPPLSTSPTLSLPVSPTHSSSAVPSQSSKSFFQPASLYLTSTRPQPRTFNSNNPPPSRLESSLLKYTPVQYSRILEANPSAPSGVLTYPPSTGGDHPMSPRQSGRDEVDSSDRQETAFGSLSPSRRGVYTPFMKLMEMTAKINIE
ncbi:myocardial zonula adherens protein isoform X2 [Periophthalmus magnuspinnatus]|uniref:myocardial zonula adherens protein isoform X2 n=1 Tax=Periophthalmus magnuspinnatus TaxID=409849 RepID=UPI002436BA9F|nr:myocardial zonula adherens protein isoform X2 [Periophthalmus magnuspinnatus]